MWKVQPPPSAEGTASISKEQLLQRHLGRQPQVGRARPGDRDSQGNGKEGSGNLPSGEGVLEFWLAPMVVLPRSVVWKLRREEEEAMGRALRPRLLVTVPAGSDHRLLDLGRHGSRYSDQRAGQTQRL